MLQRPGIFAAMMDMDMSTSGVPWLDQPVLLHSSRADKCKLTAAQCAFRNDRWRHWYVYYFKFRLLIHNIYALSQSRYQADHIYALSTVYLCCAIIGVFAISNFLAKSAPERVKRTRVWRATTSFSRYMAYRGYRFPVLKYWSPSLGVLMLGIIGAAFFFGRWLV